MQLLSYVVTLCRWDTAIFRFFSVSVTFFNNRESRLVLSQLHPSVCISVHHTWRVPTLCNLKLKRHKTNSIQNLLTVKTLHMYNIFTKCNIFHLFFFLQKIEPTNNVESGDNVLGSLARMTVLITHLIVEFAKSLPGFDRLSKDDQIILLKVMYKGSFTLPAHLVHAQSFYWSLGSSFTLVSLCELI